MVDLEMCDLVTRLQQIEEEIALLASQQQEIQHQLQTAELARDRRRNGEHRQAAVKCADSSRGQAPVDDTVDEASQESFPCSDAPAWSLTNRP